MEEDFIYYYTSNFVLEKWLESEKIWATRTVTSNDSMDTLYITRHFEKIKENFSGEKSKLEILEALEEILYETRYLSLRAYKDMLQYIIKKDFEGFKKMINIADKRYKEAQELLIIGGNNEFSRNGEGYSFLKCDIEREEILYEQIMRNLSDQELNIFLNIDLKIKESHKASIPRLSLPFSISFTYKGDDRFLWDSYTKNQGVCLQFSKSELKKYLSETYSNNEARRVTLRDVLYEENTQIEHLMAGINNEIFSSGLFGKFEIGELLSIFASMCKSPFWKVENEVRVVFYSKYFNDKNFIVKENYDLKYKNEYKTQDYIEVNVPKSLLKGITLGPLNPYNTDDKIGDYINKIRGSLNDYTIVIEKSKGTGIVRQ